MFVPAFLFAFLATKANCLNLNLVMESAGEITMIITITIIIIIAIITSQHCSDEADLGADGRIFGSGINFNTTSLSDIGSEIIIAITKITSHHCHHNMVVSSILPQPMWCLWRASLAFSTTSHSLESQLRVGSAYLSV